MSATDRTFEVFKATSTFISSVIIAFAGVYVTASYNSAQVSIARNRELAQLIPNLGSSSPHVREYTAISLALYGKYAVPVLVAALDDETPGVNDAAVESLGVIGLDAAPTLDRTFLEKRNASARRGGALYALGLMRAPETYNFALRTLENVQEDRVVRRDAAIALGFLKDKRAGEELCVLLKDPDEDVRIAAIWAIAQTGDMQAQSLLSEVENHDKSEKVKAVAKDALAGTEGKQ